MSYDSNWDKVPILIHFNGGVGSTAIINEVTGISATAVGNTSLSKSQFKFGGTSCYFDGSGDWVEMPYSPLYDPSSTDFTVELWTYCTQYNASTYSVLCGTYSYGSVEGGTGEAGWLFGTLSTSGYIVFGWGNGGSFIPIINTTTSLPINVWCHLALCKVGNQYTIYLNGTSIGTSSYSTPVTYTKTKLKLGGAMGNDGNHYYFYNGYLDELRITKGLARYTGNFTPPTEKFPNPLPDRIWDKDTLLLRLNGTNNSTVFMDEVHRKKLTPSGNVKISTDQSKFGGSSAYFDGTVGYLQVPRSSVFTFGSGDFTIEFWVYSPLLKNMDIFDFRPLNTNGAYPYIGLNSNGSMFYYVNTANRIVSSSGAVSANTWAHVAVIRSNLITTLYINGSSRGSWADSTTYATNNNYGLRIGYNSLNVNSQAFQGYLDSILITKGSARYTGNFTLPDKEYFYPYNPYWEAISLLMHFEGANNSTTFINESGSLITVYGNSKISTSQFKFGSSSGSFGSGDSLSTTPASIGTLPGDFTIECWVYANSTSPTYIPILDARSGIGYQNWMVGLRNVSGTFRPEMLFDNGKLTGTTTSLQASTWTHVACVRSGSTVSVFVNGVKDATTYTYSGAITPAGSMIYIAAIYDGIQMNGYLDELCITNGYARYLTDFVPPTAPYSSPAPSNLSEVNQLLFNHLISTTQKNILSDDNNYYKELVPYYDDSGIWTVTGTVTIKAVPVQATVYLFKKDDKRLIASTLSNSQGKYTFSGLKNQSYFVWAEDPTAVYDPVTRLALNEVI